MAPARSHAPSPPLPLAPSLLIGAIALIAAAVWIRTGPLPGELRDPLAEQSTVIVDRNGRVIYEALSASETRSRWLSADQLPQHLIDATVAAEDHRFFRHVGVDPTGIARAAWRNLRSGGVREGGSTITQQVVRQLCRSCAKRRSVSSKVHEMVLALRMEHRFTKAEILALYLNSAPYGNQIIGINRASETYFGVKPARLTLAQAALLAGLPKAPSRLNPYQHASLAIARQQRVLSRIERANRQTGEAIRVARAERLQFAHRARTSIAPHFVEKVLASFGQARPARIETTLDAGLQREIAGIIGQHEPLLARHGARNVAVVVLENATGEWLAWEGSGDYFSDVRSGSIDGVTSPRQPGSALKPFTYALAFEQGFSPAIALPDIPSHFPTAVSGIVYTPQNYDGIYRGPLRARAALAGSENVPAVWLLSEIGPAALLQFLRTSGFTTLPKTADYYGLGLTLGNAEVRLDELVSAYAIFARGGVALPSRFIRGADSSARRIISPETAFWITDVLSDSEARQFVFGSGGSLDFAFPVAVKTGTSQAYRDNWTIGFTRDVTVGVWVGNFDRTELRNSSGVTGAAPIFHAVMVAAQKHAGEAILAAPDSLTRIDICALSGMRTTRDCPVVRAEWVRKGDRSASCDWHSAQGVRWPSEYRDWARRNGLLAPDEPAIPKIAAKTRSDGVSRADSFEITSPAEGATYYIDPTLRREFQALPLRVSDDSRDLRWKIDGRSYGSREWPIVPGTHEITVRDASGRTDSVIIYVK